MKSYYIIALALVACAAAESYSTENDNVDIPGLVANTEALQAFVNCFLDKGPCPDVTAAFKKVFPDAVETKCSKCNPAQKKMTHIFLTGLEKSLPEAYEALKKKYDPEGKHFTDFENSVKP